LDLSLDVAQRLADLCCWLAEWSDADAQLRHQVASLDPRRRADVLRGSQIASLRRQLAYQVTRQPIALDPEVVRGIGVANLWRYLSRQYAQLDRGDRQRWLANLTFLPTPNLQALIAKLEAIRLCVGCPDCGADWRVLPVRPAPAAVLAAQQQQQAGLRFLLDPETALAAQLAQIDAAADRLHARGVRLSQRAILLEAGLSLHSGVNLILRQRLQHWVGDFPWNE
jgi:hypothetical protein